MTKKPFTAFIELVNYDHQIRLLTKKIQVLESEILILEIEKQSPLQLILNMRHTIELLKKEVSSQEEIMKELDAQERKMKKDLDSLSSYKEYQSIKSEIEMLQAQQQSQEQLVINTWAKLETAIESLEKEEPKLNNLFNQIDVKIKTINQEIEQLSLNLNEHKKNRPLLEQDVPKEWLEKYCIMQSRVEDPVVPIDHNSCSACFYTLTGQDSLQAKHGGLVQCKGCYRLMFLEEIHGSFQSVLTSI